MAEDGRGETPRGCGWGKWRFALVGCSVVLVFVFLLLGITVFALYRSPYYQGIAQCRVQIGQVGAALERYSIKNDAYPASLKDLVPEYLSAKKLYCPAGVSLPGNDMYVYTRPRMDAPPRTVVLTCERHVLRRTGRPTRIDCLKNGQVVLGR